MINGIILLDKPQGKTSRDMVNELNHIFDMKKIGHTGTLDPLAEGLLIMCLGKYTKLVSMLQNTKKEYIATVKMGIKTDTLDITGKIIKKSEKRASQEDITKVLASIKGEVTQEIPLYSAKKINGKKLYEYARENIAIKPPTEVINIYSLELIDFKEDEFTFKAVVGKGTYIRSIIELICTKLAIIGTMKALRRTKEWHFDVDKDASSIEEIKKGNYKLYKAQDIFPFKTYNLTDEEYYKVRNGNKIYINENTEHIILMYQDKEVAIYQKENAYYKAKIMLI